MGDITGVMVEAGISVVFVGVDVVDGDDWLQDEREIRHSSRKEQRKVARFLIIGIL